MKLQDFIKLIAIYAEDNKAIRRFHFDFSDNLGQISSEDDQFPLLYLEVTSSSNLDNAVTGYKGSEFGFNIFVVDTINRSRSNILSILNDTELVMQDIKGYVESISGIQLQDGSMFIEPLNNAYYDNLAGMSMRLTIQVDGGDDCAVSFTECTPITLEFMNTIGDLITRRNLCVTDNDIEVVVVPSGNINLSVNGEFKELIDVPSGATISYDIEVGDGEVVLYNTEGEELQRSDIGPDEVKNLIAPDASVDVMCNDVNLITMSIPSNNNVVLNIPQSDWNEIDINDPSYIKNKPTIPTPIDEFTELIDTPNDYTNQGGKIVAVKADESGLEFITGGGSGTQVQSNWAETDSGEMSYILNKPDLSGYASIIYVDNEISNLNIPTKTSDLINDDGFVTSSIISGLASETYVNTQISAINIPTKTSDLINDDGFITISQVPTQVNSDWDAVSGVAQILNKPNLSGFATQTYVDNAIGNLNIPTKTSDLTNDNGFVTSSIISGLASETYVNNQISNLNIPTATSDLINDDGFITLAQVPVQINSDWNSVSGVSQILNKPDLSGYASVIYVDNAISNLNIPTKTSDLTNDNGFITSSSLTGLATETYVNNQISAIVIPTKTSDLTNDSFFQNSTQVTNAISDATKKVDVILIMSDITLNIASHYGKFITGGDSFGMTITVPTNATQPFEIGTRIDGFVSIGDVVFAPASGVTIQSEDSNLTASEHTGWSLIKTGSDNWILVGKLK